MDRAIFKDGIIVYSCIGSNSISSFMTNFVLAIINSWGGEGDMADTNTESEEIDKSRKFVNSNLEQKEVLLILNDLDEVLESDEANFLIELELLLGTHPHLKVLTTSRARLNTSRYTPCKPYQLGELSPESSCLLLKLQASRKFDNKEVM